MSWFERYERADERYGPHLRTLWLFVISVIVLLALNAQSNTVDDVEQLAKQNAETVAMLAKLRRESVPVANRRNDAICDALKILIEGQRQQQSPESLKLFASLFDNIDPAILKAQLAQGKERTDKLDAARSRLVCIPIPDGP